MSQRVDVETLSEDRFARTTQITIGEKTILTPNFGTLIKTSKEFNALMRLGMLEVSKYLGSYVIRLFDAPDIIFPRLKNRGQMEFKEGKLTQSFFNRFNQKNIAIIDPSLEYLLYEFHYQKFLQVLKRERNIGQFDALIKYLEKRDDKKQTLDPKEYESWKKAFHKNFWYSLDRSPVEKGRFVGDFLEFESLCGTDIIIPPVPIVNSEGMLDIAMRINTLTRAIAPRTKPCATYLLLHKGVLRNEGIVKKIINIIKADSTQLTIIKFKNLDLFNPGRITQRENYRLLMDAMYETRKKNPQKIFIALENWFQSFASACYGFNIVSTSMHGYDKDSDYGRNKRGSWFDPEVMWYIPYNDLAKTFKNNGDRLPCYCSVCKRVTNLEKINQTAWNQLRREHYVLTMNEYMRMINEAVKDRHIELAREKLANSELSRLTNLIPRHIDAEW